jgi:hypothetical protein
LSDGKLRYVTSKVTESVSKGYILSKLTEYFKSKEKAKEVTDYLYNSRGYSEKTELKRTITKKKLKSENSLKR